MMMKPNEFVSQNYVQTNEKLIINPFQLFVYQLQTKDIATKKTSIQTVHIIALAMNQKQIVDQLLPYMMKLMIEQTSKDIKLTIVKSFKNILPLLRKQGSFLNFIEIIVDIILVFDDQEIKSQALENLATLLFETNLLNFQIFKYPFKTLITQELIQINEPSNGKCAKQIIFYLTKYMFKNKQNLTGPEIEEMINFLKENFLLSTQHDYFNLKLLAENFHIFVQVWPQSYKHEMYQLIDCFMGRVQGSEDKEKNYQIYPQVQKPKNIPEKVLIEIKSSLTPTIINLAKRETEKIAFPYLQSLLKQEDPKIKISLIKKTKQLFETFKSSNLQLLINTFKTFTDQPQQIKKVILEYVQQIPFDQNYKKQAIFKSCQNAIELKNILIQALIKNNKSQSISQILNESDYDFKIKIFTKLPDSLLHENKLYADIVDSLLSQPKKNFRSKLNIIMNLISRIQEKSKNQQNLASSFDISYLVNTLLKYFGDKIAIIRVNIAKLFALILANFKIPIQSFKSQLEENFYGEGKTWIEKQTVLIMIKQYLLLQNQKQRLQKRSTIQKFSQNQTKQLYLLIKQFLKNSLSGFKTKDNSKVIQINNITNLALQIIKTFSIQI